MAFTEDLVETGAYSTLVTVGPGNSPAVVRTSGNILVREVTGHLSSLSKDLGSEVFVPRTDYPQLPPGFSATSITHTLAVPFLFSEDT